MRRWMRKLMKANLQKKMTIAILFLVIIPIFIINLLFFRNSAKVTRDNVLRYDQNVLTYVQSNFQTLLEQMITTSNIACFDRQVIRELKLSQSSQERLPWQGLKTLYDRLSTAQTPLLRYTSYANLYDLTGKRISLLSTSTVCMDDLSDIQKQLQIICDRNGKMTWFAPLTLTKGTQTEHYIALGRSISGVNDPAYVLMVMIDIEQIQDKFLSAQAGEEIFLVNEQNDVIASSNNTAPIGSSIDALLQQEPNGRELAYSWTQLEHNNWRLLKITDYTNRINPLVTFTTDAIIFLLIMSIVFLLITILISRSILSPIKQLQQQMENITSERLEIPFIPEGENEIQRLGQSFRAMLLRIEELIKKSEQEREERERLRLELMQAQINPHFIFNTLNAIKWTAIIHNEPEISDLIQDFGRIVGMSIKDIECPISLQKELENVNSYFRIELLRFDYPIALEIKCTEQYLRCLVPKLVLQPLVENAIMHGFDISYCKELHITVEVEAEENQLILRVLDDGCGIDQHRLKEITEDLQQPQHLNRFNRVGLQNVHQRIRLMYGAEYGLKIINRAEGGVCVDVLLPLAYEEEQT